MKGITPEEALRLERLAIERGGRVIAGPGSKAPAGTIAPIVNPVDEKPQPKHGNRRTLYNGIWYDSKSEARRAEALDHDFRSGRIRFWMRQVGFLLGVPEMRYKVDFVVFGDTEHPVICEEVKGHETESYRKKREFWISYGPFPLRVIRNYRVAETIFGGLYDVQAKRPKEVSKIGGGTNTQGLVYTPR